MPAQSSVPIEVTVGSDAASVKFASLLFKFVKNYFLLILPAFVVLRFLYRRYASPLRQYPGPFFASGSRLWKTYITWKGQTPFDFIDLHKKYGPIVRIAPNELSFSSPAAAADVFRAGKGFRKTDFYWVFPPPGNPDIFTEIREDVHAQKKRFVVTPYSLAAMNGLASFVDDTEDLLFNKLDGFVKEGKPFDFGAWLHYFAFDVLGEVAFSRKFGFLDAGYDIEGCIKTIDDTQWYDGIVGQIPFLDYFFRRNPLWQYIPGLKTKDAVITRIALQEMEKRKKYGSNQIDRKDLMSQLLVASETAPDKFGVGDVFAVAHGAIFAGSDSTASTMQSFFHLVLSNPNVYKKICDEIDEAQSSGKLGDKITFQEAQQLPYFQAALKEAMRMRPGVGLNITRHVPSAGAEIDGMRYPGGTRVALNGWVLHRDRGVFGEDADIFRPERWLDADEKRIKAMDRSMYQFGGGSHLCIGRNLAIMEMNKVLPQLLREYSFRLAYPGRPLKSNSTFFVVQSGLEVYIGKRR
ncbi:cytochrome P450 [Rhizodiscina lignyota]|uniref:Cytochrome P450 n=1 Tax=Rhizodiscina lignyota TaxID=1504668 RepID=A0A9P4IHX9_9PEZI|nr:cytochrome P450 [Rhizodiscina lignyota]